MKSKIVRKEGTFAAAREALASFFNIFTWDSDLHLGNLQHADIYIGDKHYKARGKMLNASRVNECFRLSIEDDSEHEDSLVLRRMVKDFVIEHPNCRGLLKREWELFQQLKMDSCPYLVKLIDYIEEEDALISQLIPGLSLDLFVKQDPEYYFKRRTTLKMLKQLVRAVGFLHESGMYHLDITPACILVRGDLDHDIVLLNNGLAAATHDHLPLGPIAATGIPPELQRGDTYDHRTDIWQIGKIIRMIIEVRRKDPTRASNHLKLIASKCMKANMENRYNSVWEILKDLEAWEHLYDRFG
jgi:serine/threonine protein kinase